jgi:NAD(P) transhydrogenase subunit alpha
MDVLSSQANLAGYQAVIDGAPEYDRALPMMMTAAGTVPAAKSLRHGRRRCRPSGDRDGAPSRRRRDRDGRAPGRQGAGRLARREIHRRRGRGVQGAETAGGYAKEMSKEYQAKQAALVAEHICQAGHRHHHGADSRPSGAASRVAPRWSPR